MKRIILASMLSSGLIIGATVLATAAPAPKVFVCKYVGTPGVDERLQTGQNPISVSSNSIKDYNGVGSSFNDKQGRSLVIAIDNGSNEPICPETSPPPPDNEQPPESIPPVAPPVDESLNSNK